MGCLVPLQVSQLVESLTTFTTIEYRRVAVHCLHVSFHVAKLSERLVADFTRIVLSSAFVRLEARVSYSDGVVFFVFELDVPPQ